MKAKDGRAKNGGAGRGQGRKATKSALPGGADFAQRILARIIELKNGEGKPLYENAEDFGLQLLGSTDVRVRKETFLALLFWMFGKPVQPIDHNPDDKPVVIEVIELGADSRTKANRSTAKTGPAKKAV